MNFYQIRYYIIFSERIEWYLKAISNVKKKENTKILSIISENLESDGKKIRQLFLSQKMCIIKY